MWHVTLLPPDAILGSINAPKMRLLPLGSLQRSPDPLAVFEGAASQQGRGGEGRAGKGEGREGEGEEGREMDPRNFENRSMPMNVCRYGMYEAGCNNRHDKRNIEQPWWIYHLLSNAFPTRLLLHLLSERWQQVTLLSERRRRIQSLVRLLIILSYSQLVNCVLIDSLATREQFLNL